jgi:acyl-CoA dehydrogenase
MDFELTLEQETIRKAVAELAGKFPDTYWAACDDRQEFPWDFYNAFAEAGWLGIAIPTQYGGGGLGVFEAALMLEEVAASGAAMNGCSTMHLTIFGLNVVAKHGSEELRQAVLPEASAGRLHVCFGVTEPDAGSDTTRISTQAIRDGDSYIIRGQKVWITKAGQSQKILLLARTTARAQVEKPTDGFSLFLADLDSPSVRLKSIPKLGRNAVASYEVFFDDLRVPESCRVGDEGQGFRYILDGLNPERILLAHEAIGIGRAALDKAVAYAKQRVVFGRPIGANQAIAFPLAECHSRLEAARLIARKAAWLYDRGAPCASEANAAKFLCADASFQAADAALQAHGGMGYAREFHVERYFREARLMRLAPVSQEMTLNYLSQHVLGLPRSY